MYLLLTVAFFIILFILTFKFLRIKELREVTKIFYELRSGKPILSTLFQVNVTSPRHGGELVTDVLKAHDVKEIFTLCGGHISPILVACESLGIKVFDTRHEVNAVFAADCVSRLRQNIGVAVVTAGPGITNSITGLKNAQMAESPLLLIGGGSPTLLRGRGALQDINQQILVKPLCKFTARVRAVSDIVPTLRKAICIAKSGTPGPVFVELPIDVLYPYSIVEKEIGFSSKNPKGTKQILEFFLRAYISWVFGVAWRPQPITPLPIDIPMPKQSQINSLINLLSSSQRPLLLFGSQAIFPPIEPNTLAKAVETLGIPVYLGGMSRGLLGANSLLQMIHNRKEALQNADLIILAGSVCDFRLSYGRILNPKAKIVVINRSRAQMLKNHGLFWRSTLAIQADVASTIVQVANNFSFKENKYSQALLPWFDQLTERERLKEENNTKKALEKCKDGKLNPLLLLKALQNVLSDDTILVADGGDFVGSAAYMLRPRGPLQWLDPGAFGTLGVGGGFALGARAVHPNKPVLILFGDGACGFSLMEFDTFVRHRLSISAIIGNDACWSQIARDQMPWFNSLVACELAFTHYEKVGEGLGADGAIIEKSEGIEEIEQKLRQFLKMENSKPIVINAIIGKTTFREGSISV